MARDARTPPTPTDLLNQKALLLLFMAKLGEDLAALESQLHPDHRSARPAAAGSTPTCVGPREGATREGGRPTEHTTAAAAADSRPFQLTHRPPLLQLTTSVQFSAAAAAADREPDSAAAAAAAAPAARPTAADFSVADLPSLPLNAESADWHDEPTAPPAAAAAAAADPTEPTPAAAAATDSRFQPTAATSAILTAAAAAAIRLTVPADSAAA